jgi:hypothetical protein
MFLERDGDAVQQAVDASACTLAVKRVGDREGAGVHRDDRVELVFVRGDAREVTLHDLVRRRAFLREGASKLGDAGLYHREGGRAWWS